MNYEVHFGVELPFWISLPDGSYQIRLDGETHKLNFSNHVSRIAIGDFAIGQRAIDAHWVHTNDAEATRKALQANHAGMPVTRHDAKTVLTHARSIEVSDETVLHDLYEARRLNWYEQTLRLFNKFIQAYMIKAHAGVGIGQAGAVASWDLGGLLVSFWQVGTPDGIPLQIGGNYELVRSESLAPAAIGDADVEVVKALLAADDELPLVDVLHCGAAAQIERGAYRNAIIDDITALELEAERVLRDLVKGTLPVEAIDRITRRYDDVQRWTGYLKGRRLSDSPVARQVRIAREQRHLINHVGLPATRQEALDVHSTVADAIAWLRPAAADRT